MMGSQSNYYQVPDTDREKGCIRSIANAYSGDGGLAVLYGNIARDGSIVKTAGVDPSMLTFTGTARVFDSQEEACNGILGKAVSPGDVVVIRYEGPRGGPGMQEMLYPTSYLKSMKLDKVCALVTDGRFSGAPPAFRWDMSPLKQRQVATSPWYARATSSKSMPPGGPSTCW